jgi:CheY-like chemotaxis protein
MTSQHSTNPNACVVLLVDDDPDIVSLCSHLLAWSGHTVETAADGHSALEALSTGRFEAAVLDVDIPGKSGIEVAREIRAGEATKGCAIIFHTGTSKRDIDDQFTGYDALVAKPCFGNELADALSDAVGAKRGTPRPAA